MTVLEQKADNIVSNAYAEGKVTAIEPFLIIAIIGLMIDAVSLWIQCANKAEDLIEEARNPGLLTKKRLRSGILRMKRKNQLYGLTPEYLQSKIFEVVASSTKEQVEQAMKEAVHYNSNFNHTKCIQ